MADFGEQPASKVLPPDPDGQKAAASGTGNLGSLVFGNRLGARSRRGGVVMISEFLSRFRFLIFRKKPDELEQELQFHLEQSIESKMAAGLSATEARRLALIEFGGIEPTR